MNMHLKHKKSGFSLLELLAVVTILGIIASVIVPRITVSTDTAKNKVQKHQITTMNAAIDLYYVVENAFPTALADLVPTYVPDGIPALSPTGGTYGLDGTTYRVTHTPAP